MITITYSLTQEDYRNYYAYVTWSSPEKKRSRLLYYGKQVLIFAGLIAVMLYFNLLKPGGIITYALIGYTLVSTLGLFITNTIRLIREADKFAEDPQNASIFLETTVQADEYGITTRDEFNLFQSTWKAFIKKQETKDYYYLFRNSAEALIIPKRVFKSQTDKAAFEKLMASQLSIDAEIGELIRGKN